MAKLVGFILLTVILVGFAIPSLFMSKTFAMDRATLIEAPAGEIHEHVRDLRTWKEWTAWNKTVDPSVEYVYVGNAGEIGHSMEWTGDKLGNGKLTLTAVEGDRITYDMMFDGEGGSEGSLVLVPRDDGRSTAVRWEFGGTMEGMPYKRYFGLMVDKMVGPDFEKGLATLKAQLEGAK